MKLNLPSDLYSLQDLKSVILELQNYSRWFSETAIKMHLTKNEPSGAPILTQSALLFLKEFVGSEPIDQQKLDGLVETLTEFLDKSAVITITLAGPAPDNLKKQLVDWCRKNINPNILVSFNFKSVILGGAVIQYGSHIYDWSFRRQILAAQGKFPEVLRNVR